MSQQQQRGQRGQLPPPRGGNGQQQRDGVKEEAQRLFEQLRHDLNNDEFRNRVAAECPRDFRTVGYVDRLCESIFLACRDNPKLLTECDRGSLFKSAERIAKKGLTVGDNIAWLVPYAGQVQDQLGYRGSIIMVRRALPEAMVSTASVFENDVIDIDLGTTRRVTHKVDLRSPRGRFIGCYATIQVGTWVDVEPADLELIEYVRSMSPSKNSPAWNNWFDEQSRKIPLKRLLKRQPTERAVDLTDMDDRTIEGSAEVLGIRPAANLLTQSAEVPIATAADFQQQPREKETVRTDKGSQGESTKEQKQAAPTETVDQDGVVREQDEGSAPHEGPQQNGGRRRGGRGGTQNGSLAFSED